LREECGPLEEHLAWAQVNKPAAAELLDRVLGEAARRKREKRIESRITQSGLKVRKSLEAFDWAFQPKLDRVAIEVLATFAFVDKAEDVLMTGQSGTGKSHILQALAMRACEREFPVRYTRCVDLLDDLYAGLADGSYPRRVNRWSRSALLVIDDVGLGHVRKREDEPTAAQMLFNLLDRRHLRVSTAISSNIKLSAWGKYLGDATLAVALLDRLAMNSIRIDIDGPSYRQHIARARAQAQGAELTVDTE
jgi:DNA replication protein DnaC